MADNEFFIRKQRKGLGGIDDVILAGFGQYGNIEIARFLRNDLLCA